MFCVKIFHFVISILLFYLFWLLFRYNEFPQVKDVGFRYNYIVLTGFAVLLLFFNRTYNSFLFGYTRIGILAFSQFLSQLFSVIIIYFLVSIAWASLKSPLLFVALLGVFLLLNIGASVFGNWLYFRLNPPRKTLLIYRSKRDRRHFGTIKGKPVERLYQVVNELEFDGSYEEIRDELNKGYDAIFVSGVNSRCRNGILKHCEENDIRGFFLPHIGDVIMQGAQHIQSFDTPVMMARRKILSPEYRVLKRLFDAVVSALGLVVLSPVFLITAIAIKAYDHGPVFYRQVRLTKDGREFKIIKFRSMRVDAENDGVARLSTGDNDDRITPQARASRNCRAILFNNARLQAEVAG